MTIMDKVVEELRSLSEAELEQVAEYLAFLKFRARYHAPTVMDEGRVAALYAQFAEEDRQLAEEGMQDYCIGLQREDASGLAYRRSHPSRGRRIEHCLGGPVSSVAGGG